MINCDLLIVTVPFTDTNKPLQAPAILKAVVEEHNFTAETCDLNYEFLNDKHDELDFLKQYFSFGTANDHNKIILAEDYVEEVTKKLLQNYNPTFINF